jgi:hypothetical protein
MRDKSKGDKDRCHGRRSNNLSQLNQFRTRSKRLGFLPNFS